MSQIELEPERKRFPKNTFKNFFKKFRKGSYPKQRTILRQHRPRNFSGHNLIKVTINFKLDLPHKIQKDLQQCFKEISK